MAYRDLIYAMLSDRGRVRRRNEDTCAAYPLLGAFVVCDGMGGVAGGEVASHLAAETFLSHLRQNGARTASPQVQIETAMQAANRAIFQQAQRTPHLSGMGTTLVGMVVPPAPDEDTDSRSAGARPNELPPLWLVHVGDSRCYRWRRPRLERLTQDHSLVEEQVRAGQITPAQAEESPMRNLITRAVGSQATVEPEIHNYRPQESDLYLLASDGLTRELSEGEIAAILCQIPSKVTQSALYVACRALVQAANAKGGGDNITVLIVAMEGH